LSLQLGVEPAAKCVKTLLVDGSDGGVVALVVRGDHELNAVKAQKLPGVANPLRMASGRPGAQSTGTEPGFIGPLGFTGKIYVDHAAAHLADFVCGANEKDMHFTAA
jgi:prolyl-tRNA synthetase